jgi:hypothetical protein
MGGQNMCDIHLVLKRLVELRFDGLLEKGVQDWMHFLGTSKLDWAVMLTDIQRAVRKYHNANFTISFDCASPFLATANGQIYYQTETNDRSKWTYRMGAGADDKKYKNDRRLYKNAIIQDKILNIFESSPIIDKIKLNEICVYGPGDVNKFGQSNKTSWDSFSYGIMMGHNVWHHINAVQEANRQYDSGTSPNMLCAKGFKLETFRDIVDEIFAANDKEKALEMIEKKYQYFWNQVIGTRGASGKRATSAIPMFNKFFEELTPEVEEFDEEDELKLEALENDIT